jgi:hypothetical protein
VVIEKRKKKKLELDNEQREKESGGHTMAIAAMPPFEQPATKSI